MYFNQARNYYPGRRRRIRLIVIHTAETSETPTTAEGIINYFAGPNAPQASCHYVIDNNSIAQGVQDSDTAWAAPGANADGLQLEHAGYAGQGPDGWSDAYSQAMLENSARLTAQKCREYGIQPKHVTGEELRTGTGICGHNDVNQVYGQSNHWDPGPDFPWDHYISRVNAYLGNETTTLGEEELDNTQAKQLADSAWLIGNSIAPATGRIELRTAELVNASRSLSAQVAALSAAVESLAKANGADPQAISKSIDEAVNAALKELKLTLSVSGEEK